MRLIVTASAVILLTLAIGVVTAGERSTGTRIQTYDGQGESAQAQIVRSALATLYKQNAAKDPDKASCMVKLNKPVSEAVDDVSNGYMRLVLELEKNPPAGT